jgi:hypothetical protein
VTFNFFQTSLTLNNAPSGSIVCIFFCSDLIYRMIAPATISQECESALNRAMTADSLMRNRITDLQPPIPVINGFEVLCHNISHSDLVLSINDHAMSHANGRIIAKPGFSFYKDITGRIVQKIAKQEEFSQILTLNYPTFSRRKNGESGTWLYCSEIDS